MGVLDGKVALITGGASGMGRASALLFASEGARVAIADLNDQMGNETVDMAKRDGGDAIYIHADVSRLADLENMVRSTVKAYGKLNIFWHNAGNAGPGMVERTSEADFDKTMAIHVKGGFFGAKFAVPEIKKAGGGCLLFTSSTAAIKPSKGSVTYSLAKSSELMLSKCLAVYYAKDGIRSNAIIPGLIDTPLMPQFFGRDPDVISPDVIRNSITNSIPLARLGKPDNIAQAALFLCSDAASYITGAVLTVDGGFSST